MVDGFGSLITCSTEVGSVVGEVFGGVEAILREGEIEEEFFALGAGV